MSADSARFTLDTNVLIYSADGAAGMRHQLAIEIVSRAARSNCWLMLQAISEFYSAVTRKAIMPKDRAVALAGYWLDLFPHAAASAHAVRAALGDALAGRASYWDALLVATAGEVGCAVMLSEDLADGATLSGVEIHNPFAPRGGLTERTGRLLDL
jgi:predicted nucleic acid-binding protein